MTTCAFANRFAYLDEVSDKLDEALVHSKALLFKSVWYRKQQYKSLSELSDDEHKSLKGKLIEANLTLIGFNVLAQQIDLKRLTSLVGYYKSKYLVIDFDDKKSYTDKFDLCAGFADAMAPMGVTVACPYYWWLNNHPKQFSAYKLDAKLILNNINVNVRQATADKNVVIVDTVDVMPGHGTQWLGDGRLDFGGCVNDRVGKVAIGCAHSMFVRHGNTKVDNMRVVLKRLEQFYDKHE